MIKVNARIYAPDKIAKKTASACRGKSPSAGRNGYAATVEQTHAIRIAMKYLETIATDFFILAWFRSRATGGAGGPFRREKRRLRLRFAVGVVA
jgi:hypothetical protein